MELTRAERDVLAERQRQVESEGWSSGHDDEYEVGTLASAAINYATPLSAEKGVNQRPVFYWPWDLSWWKPSSYRRNLIKAASLILAEIERLDRAESKKQP